MPYYKERLLYNKTENWLPNFRYIFLEETLRYQISKLEEVFDHIIDQKESRFITVQEKMLKGEIAYFSEYGKYISCPQSFSFPPAKVCQ